ncbi:orotidine-5'-phosphate decarboxylase [Kangiella sp. TOML190]|uniref:orotidine-5'-phosphate decarboxylase n=1 Tax=Kangiella sp. TOML190 TaxID=2931351 RepID=UPI00203D00B8|nr:orotidine-5'-phosphate decarboxylase [Kangiella sp. TOML190]
MTNVPKDSAPNIIVALDFADKKQALNLVDQLDPNLAAVKVGKEMFTLFGPKFVKKLVKKGFKVFLDLKFHDIPNTVAKACRAAAELGVWMTNVHASGGVKMMQMAREAIQEYGDDKPLLIGVTMLTSMDEANYQKLGYSKSLAEQVQHLAGLTQESGLDGVVCSAWEAQSLKQQFGVDFKLVTPGIRPVGSEVGDQSRIMTPAKAIAAGSDYLVIGRPITQAQNPLKALCDISESLVSDL